MGNFIGTNPPVGKNTEADVTAYVAVATAEVDPGTIQWYKDSSNRVSVLRYYQAAATIAAGAALVKSTTSRSPYHLAQSATSDAGYALCKGIAAAAVSNTSYYSWAFIAEYCPAAAINSGFASNQPMRLSGTTAAKFGSIPNINATVWSTYSAMTTVTEQHAVIWTLGSEASATSATDVFTTVSCVINGWLG